MKMSYLKFFASFACLFKIALAAPANGAEQLVFSSSDNLVKSYEEAGRPIKDRYIVLFRSEVRVPFEVLMQKHQAEINNDFVGLSLDDEFTFKTQDPGLEIAATTSSVVHVYRHISGYAAIIANQTLVNWIENQPEVLLVEQDSVVTISAVQENPYSWGLDRIDSRKGLDQKYNYPDSAGNGVKAYVIDTGIYVSHLDFSPSGSESDSRAQFPVTFINGEDKQDFNGHGTHVSGTVAGTYSGVAKKAIPIGIKALDARGSGSNSGIIAAINWIVSQGGASKSVINMSIGGGLSTALNTAVDNAVGQGFTVVVAAGNSRKNACNFSPSSAKQAIVIGSISQTDTRSYFTNFGKCVTLSAPGEKILSSSNKKLNGLVSLSGTSMAAPHVAGVVALLLGKSGETFTPRQVRKKILKLATPNVISGLTRRTPNLLVFNQV